MARRSMVGAATCDYSNANCFGKSSRTRCMENNFPHSITSPVSNEPVELPVRLNSNSLWSVHVLDHRRPRPRAIPLHVSGHPRAIRPQLGAWENPSARGGVLDVGGAFVVTALLFILLTRVALNAVRESHDLSAPVEENASPGTKCSTITSL